MRKSCFANNLFALAVAAMLSTAASAQTQKMASSRKWDGAIQHCITAKPTQSLNVLVKCQQAEKLCAFLHNKGYRATLVANQLVSARIPATLVQYVAQNFDTEYIQTPRQAKLTMNNARPAANVEKAHKGEGLLTPYTGKGVIIGVIDQGFEYRHLAFLDENGNSRVKALWNRRGFSEGTDIQPTTDIPASGDGVGDIGHATFVTNVAAGSPISENNFYGVAPGADIVMVSSELSEDEVLEDISYISSLAHTEGKPWVVNMSFGTQMGAHDGKSYFDQALNTLLDSSKACQIVAAVGNDNQHNMHAAHTFTNNRNTVKMIVNPAVMVGTTAYDYVKDIIKGGKDEGISIFDDNSAAAQAVTSGQCDALVTDTPQAVYMVQSKQIDDGLVVGQIPGTEDKEGLGITLAKNSPLTKYVKKAMKQHKEHNRKGIQNSLLRRHFLAYQFHYEKKLGSGGHNKLAKEISLHAILLFFFPLRQNSEVVPCRMRKDVAYHNTRPYLPDIPQLEA